MTSLAAAVRRAAGRLGRWEAGALPAAPPSPVDAAKNSDNIPHITGLIPPDAHSILDVGCGMLHDGNPMTEDILHEICRGGEYEVTGIDAFPPCVKWREKNGPPGDYRIMDARDVRVLGRRFDVVICHHVIEHLPKDDGRRLLATLEGMYGRLLVIATPVGFVDAEYNVRLHHSKLERHLCGWEPGEFRSRGYRVLEIKNQFIASKTRPPAPRPGGGEAVRMPEPPAPAPPAPSATPIRRSLPRRIARRAILSYRDWRDPPIVDASRLCNGGRNDGVRLVGFVKFRNEGSESGNLERCLRHMVRFCDDILACDNGSTDDSLRIAERFTSNIMTAPDDFRRELYVKQQMLEAALRLDPDWLVWLDADEVFDRSGELGDIRSLCRHGDQKGIDAFRFRYYNLWKSLDRYRTDELWFKAWQTKLWRNTGRLAFDVREGLHHQQSPAGLGRSKLATTRVIHYGFSTGTSISQKYENYKRHGQAGRMLERIRDESTLQTEPFSRDWFPPSALSVSVVCLVYKSPAYARFVHDSFERHTGRGRGARYGNVEFTFVANDPTDRLLEFLRSSGMRHTVFRSPDPDEHYMSRVYRAWNHGGMAAGGDVLVFVNSDMAFTPGWLDNLLRRLDEKTIVTSRLVESGKMSSGKYGIERDFGTTHSNFDDEAFQEFASRISEDKAKQGGLFMPCAIYADTFRRSGGYPIGNRTEPDGSTTSGDAIYFYETLKSMGVSHVTAFDSIVYHVQEGEKDE